VGRADSGLTVGVAAAFHERVELRGPGGFLEGNEPAVENRIVAEGT